MTDQNQGSIAYIFSTEMRRKIVSIVGVCMICNGIDQTYLLHFPYRSTNYRYFFEIISCNYLSNVPRQVDILDGKQTTNHKPFMD